MKKIFILFLVFCVGKGFSQASDISPFPAEGTFSTTNAFTMSSSDWNITTPGLITACNVAGSSGNELLAGDNGSSGVLEQVTSGPIATNSFVNIIVSWNAIKGTSSSPAVTFEWSNDGINFNALSFTPPSTNGVWAAVPTVSLPAGANGTTIYLRWSYTSVGGSGLNYVGIDDIKVQGTPSPAYYWNAASGPLHQVTSWFTSPGGVGSNPPDFVSNYQNFYLQSPGSATLTAAWSIGGTGSILNVGDGTVPNSCNLVIPSGFPLSMLGTAKLNVRNSSTLTIRNTTFPSVNSVALTTSSTVNFDQSTSVNLWGGASFNYGNLVLSGGGAKNQTSDVSVLGDFTIVSGTSYVMSGLAGRFTTLSGKITCSGIITAGTSNLVIDGSGTIGTLIFGGTNTIGNLNLNRTGQTLTLGTNLTIQPLALSSAFTNGSINLNGKLLALNGPVTFQASSSNGVIIGSASSSLSIGGTGSITNNLFMDQSTSASKTSALTLDRAAATLTLGNDMNISTAVFTNGNLNLNGTLLSLNGITTFPASTSNGVFIGSTTSTLVVGGSAGTAINNNLLMSQTNATTASIGTFSLNRSGVTFGIGTNLSITNMAAFPNSIFDINGNLLTLSGPISFPTTSSFGRGIKGSSTSSLMINGSGTISNQLFMNTNIELSELTLNRSGETLTLGNTLETYGTIYPNNGTFATANNLFIRSNATNKGRIAAITGVLSGNIKVETYAAGGVTDWTNLGPSGVNGLTVANWEGQIPMSCLSCPNNENSAGGYFVSIQRWDATKSASDPAAYVEMSYTSALSPAQGYWVFLGNGLGTTPAITWTVSGAATQGPLNIAVTTPSPGNFSEGFNLISNPYPSPISWSALWNNNGNVDNAIYVYNPDVPGGTTSYAGGVQSDPNGISNTIPMGQGFYVQAGANATLVAQESNKVGSNTPLLKTTNDDIGAVVRLRIDGGGYYDMTALRFHSEATTAFDRKLDARKLFSSPGYVGFPGPYTQRTTISTKSGDEDYSINSLPYAQSADAVIPVLVRVYATGAFTITGTDLENLPNSCVILKDKLTNTTHDLKISPYTFTINDTTSTPRFELRVCMDVAMSVDETKGGITADKSIVINNDENGVYVKFDYDQATKSNISVTNILGQKVIDDKSLTTVNDKVYLNLDPKQQLVFVTVSTDNKKVTKKVIR